MTAIGRGTKTDQVPSLASRKEFVQLFEYALLHAHQELVDERQLEFELNLPKSYLVEFHPTSGASPSADLLEKRLAEIGTRAGFETVRIDQTLFTLLAKTASFVVDATDPRILLLHTLARSEAADRFVFSGFIPRTPTFDRVWLTAQFLERYAQQVTVEGWAATYDPLVEPRRFEDPSFVPDRVHVQLDTPGAWERYLRFKKMHEFPQLPLDVLRVKSAAGEDIGRARISASGKLTARGNSFGHYQQLAFELRNAYTRDLGSLESRFQLRFSTQHRERLTMRGEPFWIEFPRPIENVRAFVGQLFSGKEPFRLLGFPEPVARDFWSIHAVDLHIASRLYVEAAPSWLRVFLGETGCGNSLLRLVRSLQSTVSDQLKLAAA